MLLGDVQHQLELFGRQYSAGGVAGVGDHNGPGMFVDQGFNALSHSVAVALLRAGGQRPDGGARQGDRGVVVGIEGFGNDDLVTVVQNGGHGHLQSLAAAGGDKNVLVCQVNADVAVVAAHRVQQDGKAAGRGIGQNRLGKFAHGLKIGVGRNDIGLADVQVVYFDAAFYRLRRVAVEFTHGGQTAFFHF